MKTIMQDTINLDVFDEQGNFVTRIDTAQEGILDYGEAGESTYLVLQDALFDLKMLEKIGNKVDNSRSNDFEKAASNDSTSIIKFKKNRVNPKFKLIGSGITYNVDTAQVAYDFKIIIPIAELVSGYKLNLDSGEPQTPRYSFKLRPYNEDDDLFEIQFTERK